MAGPIRQSTQVRPTDTVDDQYPLGTPSANLEDDINILRTVARDTKDPDEAFDVPAFGGASLATVLSRLAINREGRLGSTRDGKLALKRNI